ncbi:hypothetical protein ScPMuIL_013085 [Solemya velum]
MEKQNNDVSRQCDTEGEMILSKVAPFTGRNNHIEANFDVLKDLASSDKLKALTRYIESTWLTNPVWSVRSWSVYQETIRTNNDVEGWHRGLNSRCARAHPSFYILVPLLQREGQYVTIQHTLVREEQLNRDQRQRQRRVNTKIGKAWAEFKAGTLTSSQLLDRCGTPYGPTGDIHVVGEDEGHCHQQLH